MIVTTIDPVTHPKVSDIEKRPYLVAGSGATAIKTYFNSKQARQACLTGFPGDPGLYKPNETNR